MPNAGVFTNQSKVRPGAYINFKAERSVNVTGAERGIVAIPLKLGWSEGVIKVSASEIADGTFTNKLACFITDEVVAPLVEAMKYAESALVYNLVSGGEKATATVGELSVSAKHEGTRGNKLSVAVLATSSDDVFNVVTMLDGVVKNKQEVKTIAELKENDFVSFSGSGDLSVNAGVKLTGGSDGSLSSDKYAAFLAAIKNMRFNAVALPMYDLTSPETFNATVPTYVNELCDAGNKVTAVVYNYPLANCEHVVSVDQGYKTETDEVDVNAFVGAVAGMMAGTAVNVSNTYRLITGATEIINPKTDAEIEDGLRKGCFMLSQRVESDITVEKNIMKELKRYFTLRDSDGVKRTNFLVITTLKNMGISSALLEVCFITNKNDMIVYSENKKAIAEDIAHSIADSFKLKKKPRQATNTHVVKYMASDRKEYYLNVYGADKLENTGHTGYYNSILTIGTDGARNCYPKWDSTKKLANGTSKGIKKKGTKILCKVVANVK